MQYLMSLMQCLWNPLQHTMCAGSVIWNHITAQLRQLSAYLYISHSCFCFPLYPLIILLILSYAGQTQKKILEMHTQSCIPTTYLTCKDLDLHKCWRIHTLTPFTAGKHHPLLGFPHHFLPFSSCNLIGCCMGEAHCRGRNQGEGGFPRLARLIHTKPTTYTRALIHTYRESLLFSFEHTSRFWLQSAGKLFMSSAGFKMLPSR